MIDLRRTPACVAPPGRFRSCDALAVVIALGRRQMLAVTGASS